HQRQSQTETGGGARAGAVLLPEAVEDEGEKVGSDSATRVAHNDFDVRRDALQVDLDLSSLRGELHRVDQQVPHDLLESIRIAGHRSPSAGRARSAAVFPSPPP